MGASHVLSIVLLLPPAPAARVLFGLALAIFSFWSAAARRRITARAPPGGGGDSGRAPVLAPVAAGELTGDAGRGEDCVFTSNPLAMMNSLHVMLDRSSKKCSLRLNLFECDLGGPEANGWRSKRTILTMSV